ncbi:MAG: universal stress protein [Paludibacteraceae bacterium]|nr:universal stress protein [Paludibacteraceae bacterium]
MKIGLLYKTEIAEHKEFVANIAKQTSRELFTSDCIPDDAAGFCDELGIDILFISCDNRRKEIQRYLNLCRDLRLPYVFLTDTMPHLRPLAGLLSPVTMFEEEVHKAEVLGHLNRFTGAQITLLQANDYGSRAEQNTNKIITALNARGVQAEVLKARKDSFSVGRESAERGRKLSADMLVVTASRDYGLDDIFFGPQELHIIRHSNIPVMLLNPRGDLYSLCD